MLLVALHYLGHTFLVVEAFHLSVPLALFSILDLKESLVLLAQFLVARCQFDCGFEAVLRAVKVIFSFISECKSIVSLWIIRLESKSILTRLDAVLVAAFL